jgi:hypothetical protein
VETPAEVRDRVLEAPEYIPHSRLGTTDDCGFAPFGDDTSTPRQTTFEKIRARVAGTELAARTLGAAAIKVSPDALLPEVATQAFRDKSRVPVRPIIIAMSK